MMQADRTQGIRAARKRWQVPFSIRLMVAVLVAAVVAVAASYSLRMLNL
jgi:hypothetical protein